MTRRLLIALGTVSFAVLASRAAFVLSEPRLAADGQALWIDSDGDFVPDVVEWTVLSNPRRVDTDADGVSDFVEIVQHGMPWEPGVAEPADHEMRVVVTSLPDASGRPQIWMHTFFRFMGSAAALQSYRPYAQFQIAPGLRLPLDAAGWSAVQVQSRDAGSEGIWYRVSVLLASEEVLAPLLPATISAEARIGGRRIRSGAFLFPSNLGIATLVPAGDGVVTQTLSMPRERTGAGGQSNKYCLMEVEEVGGGPGGRIYEVTKADCENANDLDCSTECPESEGWVFVLPDGIGTITGG